MNKKLILAVEHTDIDENNILIESWPNGIYVEDDPFNEFIEQNEKIGNLELIYNIRTKEELKNTMYYGTRPFNSLFSYDEQFFKNYYTEKGFAIYKDLNDILPEEKYVFPIKIHGLRYSQLPIFLTRGVALPQKVIDDARSGKCKILFHQLAEGQGFNTSNIKQLIEQQSVIFNIPISAFGFLDSNAKTPELQASYGSKGFCMFWWYNHCWTGTDEYVESRFRQLNEPESKDFYFLCLNRISKPHRSLMAINIYHKWSDKTNWSYDKPIVNESLFTSPFSDSTITHEDILVRHGILTREFYDHLPKTIDIDLSYNHTQINYELMDSAYINLTTETYFHSENTLFFSEKIFKPILAIQPFILIGDAFSLRELKKLGFKTFHPIINEEYDEISDHDARLKMILTEIDRLYKMSEDEMKDLVKSLGQICIHNYNHLNYLVKENYLEKRVCEEINQWVHG
jgi:hypothetical protein